MEEGPNFCKQHFSAYILFSTLSRAYLFLPLAITVLLIPLMSLFCKTGTTFIPKMQADASVSQFVQWCTSHFPFSFPTMQSSHCSFLNHHSLHLDFPINWLPVPNRGPCGFLFPSLPLRSLKYRDSRVSIPHGRFFTILQGFLSTMPVLSFLILIISCQETKTFSCQIKVLENKQKQLMGML